jgi:hypothetical protein
MQPGANTMPRQQQLQVATPALSSLLNQMGRGPSNTPKATSVHPFQGAARGPQGAGALAKRQRPRTQAHEAPRGWPQPRRAGRAAARSAVPGQHAVAVLLRQHLVRRLRLVLRHEALPLHLRGAPSAHQVAAMGRV